jgi:Dolichyl-phosphate-mannose-protein mannosyltransferase
MHCRPFMGFRLDTSRSRFMRETQLPMSSDVAGMPARVNGRTWTHSLVASSLRWPVVIASVVYYLAVLLFQRIEGAPQAAFGAYPDEASHYISGLLLRDYLLSGSLGSPIRYATEYYIHVPFFAIGYWPPLFYAAEALWMQCWGVSRTAVLAFVALIAAGTATLLFAKLRSEFGKVAALCAGLIFLLFPVVLWSSGLVMTDLLVTFLSFAAALALARYLDSERTGPMLVFSVLASVTILAKSSGAFLAIVPILAVVVSGKLHLLRTLSFWVAPLVVAALCAPWFLLTRSLLTKGFAELQKQELIVIIRQLRTGLAENVLWLTPLILFGAWRWFRVSEPMSGFVVVCLVQPIAVFAFLIIAPVGNEARRLIPAFPALLFLAMYGIRGVADLAAPARRRAATTGFAILLTLSFLALAAYRFHPLAPDAFRPIAEFVVARGYHSVVVPADAEGPMIAEISEREPDRMARFLVRPSKLLARTDWNGIKYQPLYKTKEEVEAVFEQLPLDVLIVRMDPPGGAKDHEVLLSAMVLAFPQRWHLVASFGSPSHDSVASSYPARAARYAVYEPAPLREFSQQDVAHFLGNLPNFAPLR